MIEYLPFEKIITQSKDKIVFSSKFKNSLPTQSIFNLILYQNEIDPKIGTKIAVRHQGFLLKKSNQLIIRHADSRDKTVREINANDFFLFHYLRSKLYRNYDHAGLQILKIIE